MAGETMVTVVGNLTSDPDLRFTPGGSAVANFTVASTPRVFDRESGAWRDGDPLFLRCSLWREYAENAAESLGRGTRVVVHGRLRQRSYDTKEGEKRTVTELEVDEIGPSLRYHTATVTKAARSGGKSGGARAATDAWGEGSGHWATGAAVVRDQGGREADGGGAAGGRSRPLVEVRDRQGQQGQPERQRDKRSE